MDNQITSLKCEICLKEYDQEIIFSHELNKIVCIPCIRKHKLPELIKRKHVSYYGKKAEIKEDGLCYFEDGTIIDPCQPLDETEN